MTYAQETVVGRSLILIKYGTMSDLVLGWGLLIYWNKRKMKNMTMAAQINFKLFVDTKFRSDSSPPFYANWIHMGKLTNPLQILLKS